MPIVPILVAAVHVLAGVFWAGASFVLARTGRGAERMFRPQMIAAVLAVLTGGYLWRLLIGPQISPPALILMVGALCAIAAAGAQGALCGPAIRKLKSGDLTLDAAQVKMKLANRIAAALLLITFICMVVARYA